MIADIRYALRGWKRQPALVLVATLSLAAGIGLNTAVFSVINAIFLQSIRGVPAADRVITLNDRATYKAFREVRDNATAFASVAAWQPVPVDITAGSRTLRSVVPAVSERYFSTLDVRPALGRLFTPGSPRQPVPETVVVLDHRFWTTTLGGDPSILGTEIRLNRTPVVVIGIAPESFHGFGPERPPMWIPMSLAPVVRDAAPAWEGPDETGWRMFGRLRDGVSLGQANAELASIAARAPAVFPRGLRGSVQGAEIWTGPVSAEKQIEFLLVVVLPLVVVALILWIGCSNVANLLLAHASARRKEIAIRLASGASRGRLVRLLLVESAMLAIAGGVLGLFVAFWALDFIWATLPDAPRLAIELDGHVLAYTSSVAMLATLLFGLVPSLHATRVDVGPLLKGVDPGQDGSQKRGRRTRRFFLVTQFASSMALLIIAGTFVRTLVTTRAGETPAAMSRIAIAQPETDERSEAGRQAYWSRVREAVSRIPGVSTVTIVPTGNGRSVAIAREDEATASADRATTVAQDVDDAFFAVSGATLMAGRADLSMAVSDSVPPIVVNERTASLVWGTRDVVGRRARLDGIIVRVVGVIKDDGRDARTFGPLAEGKLTAANVMAVSNGDAAMLVDPLRTVLVSVPSTRPFVRATTLLEAATGNLARLTRLAVTIGGLVLALATVGLYGAVSFVTSLRTREIAVRVAIGAAPAAVVRLVAREACLVVAAGTALGLGLIAIAFRFMSGMIFASWSLDPLTIAGVLVAFALATAAACIVPGRRALTLDPMAVLKGE